MKADIKVSLFNFKNSFQYKLLKCLCEPVAGGRANPIKNKGWKSLLRLTVAGF
jgi:hypothetical protein